MARNRPGAGTSDYVLFPGCQLSGSSPHQVEQIYGYLTDKLDGRDVGMLLGCCGAPANWAGREDLYDATVSEWRRQLEAMGNPTVVLPCSSCHQSFKTSMPDVEIVSLWEVLDEHGPPDGVTADGRPLAVHDPCTTRHESHIHDSVRSIIGKLGFQVEELARNREQTTCCSYGGHMWLANRDLSKKVLKRRIDESATDFVTYCAMCRDFFAAEGKRTVHVLDLIFGEDLEERTTRRSPGYSQRHENRAHLKRHLLKEIWGEDMDDQAPFESIELIVADDVAALLEDRLILTDDVRRVIEHAERTGRRLRNPQGRLLAYHRPTSVTYWVEYLPEGEAFRVFNAYSHRMEIPGGGSA
jgi:hypothetical protein